MPREQISILPLRAKYGRLLDGDGNVLPCVLERFWIPKRNPVGAQAKRLLAAAMLMLDEYKPSQG
jgi:hypothetical protein